MFAHLFLPIKLKLAHEVLFLSKHRLYHRRDRSLLCNLKGRHSVKGTIITLRITIKHIIQIGRQFQVGSEFIGRSHMDCEVSILCLVLVVAITIVDDGHGVSKRRIDNSIARFLATLQNIVIITEQIRKTLCNSIILIRRHKRRLDQCKHGWRGNGTSCQVGTNAIIKDVSVRTRDSNIKLCRQIPENLNIGIETDIHTVERGFLYGIVRLNISHRQIVHTNIVTTLHIDAVVLSDCVPVHIISPVGIIMIGIIIIPIRIIIQEMEVLVFIDIRKCSQQFCSITTILRRIHHRRQLRNQLDTCRDIGINTGRHRLSTFGLNQ